MKTKPNPARHDARTAPPAPAARQVTQQRSAPPRQFNHDSIRQRAHQIYLRRLANGESGDAISDWLAAEDQFRGEALLRGSAK